MEKLPVTGTLNTGVKIIGIFVSLFGWFLIGGGILAAIGFILSDKVESDDFLLALIFSSIFVLFGVLVLLIRSWVIESFDAKYRKGLETLQENVDFSHRNIKLSRARKLQLKMQRDRAKEQFLKSILNDHRTEPITVFVAGGSGWEKFSQKEFLFTLDNDNIYLTDITSFLETRLSILELREINISGPGTVTSGGGFAGGGFGVEGFLKGAAFALVMNLLTSKTTTQSIIYLSLINSELILFNSQFDPENLRIKLSKLYLNKSSVSVPLNETNSTIVEQIASLKNLRDSNSLTDEEFIAAKKKLLT